MDPDPFVLAIGRDLNLDAAFEAVEVGLHVGGVVADVLPVARRHPAEDRLALLEELREHVTGPVGRLAGPEEVEHRRVQHVNACVGEVRDDLAPAWLLDEPLDRSALVDDHHSVLEWVGNRFEHDGGQRAALAVKANRRPEVNVSQGIAGDDQKRLVELRSREHHRAGGAKRRVLDRIGQRHTLLGAVAEIVPDRCAEVLHRGDHVAHLVATQVQEDVLHDRPPGDGYQRFWLPAGQRAEARSFATRHDHGLHVPSSLPNTIVCRWWKNSTLSLTTCSGRGSHGSKGCSRRSIPNYGSRRDRILCCCSSSSATKAWPRRSNATRFDARSRKPARRIASTTTAARRSWTPGHRWSSRTSRSSSASPSACRSTRA